MVDDLESEHRRLEDLGLTPTSVKQLEHGGQVLAKFFFIQDPDGYKVEVLQRQGRYR